MARRRIVRYNENQLLLDFNTTEEIIASFQADATSEADPEEAAKSRSSQLVNDFAAMFKPYAPDDQARASEKKFDPTINAASESLQTIVEFINDYRAKPVGFPTVKEQTIAKGLTRNDLTMANVATYLEMLNAAKAMDEGRVYNFNTAAVPTFRSIMSDASPFASIYPEYITSKNQLEHLDSTVSEIAAFATSNMALASANDRDAKYVLETCNIDQRFIEECKFVQNDIHRVWNAYERNISMQIDLAAGADADAHVEPDEIFDDVPLPDLNISDSISDAQQLDPAVGEIAQLMADYYNDTSTQLNLDTQLSTPADHIKTAEKLAQAIANMDVPALVDTYASEGRSLYGVEGGAYAFGKVTGFELKGDAQARQSAIYAFAQYTPQEILADQQRINDKRAANQSKIELEALAKAASEADQVKIYLEPKLSNQPWYEALYSSNQSNGHVCTGREWVDTLIENGFHHLRSQKVGAIDKSYLANDVNDAYLLNHEDLRPYALIQSTRKLESLAEHAANFPETLVHQGDYALSDAEPLSDVDESAPQETNAATSAPENALSASYQLQDDASSVEVEEFESVPVPDVSIRPEPEDTNHPPAAIAAQAPQEALQQSQAIDYTYEQLQAFTDDQRFAYANALYDQIYEVQAGTDEAFRLTAQAQNFARHVSHKDHLAEAYLNPVAAAMGVNLQYQEQFIDHVRTSARMLKDMAWSLGGHDGITGDVIDQLLSEQNNFAKSQRDSILMERFGISRLDAHSINNGMDDMPPGKLTSAEIESCLDEFPAVRQIIEAAKQKALQRQAPVQPESKSSNDDLRQSTVSDVPPSRTTNRAYAHVGDGQNAQLNIITSLNKKAATYGLPPVRVIGQGVEMFVAVDKYVQSKGEDIGVERTLRPYKAGEKLGFNDRVVELAYVDIEYDIIKKEGYSVLAQISIDDLGIPAITQMGEPKIANEESYLAYLQQLVDHSHDENMACDHCETNRQRKTVYALESETGEFKTIGSTCVEDYIGLDPNNLANLVKFYQFVSFQNIEESGELCAVLAGKGAIAYNTVDLVTAAVAVVDEDGRYISAKQAEENMVFSTRDKMLQMIHDSLHKLQNAPEYEVARSRAHAAIEYAKTIPPENTFAINMAAAAQSPIALDTNKMTMGLLASLPTTYERALRNTTDANASVHVGKKGEKIEAKPMQIQTAIQMDGDFGLKNMFVLKDENANVFKWTSTGRDPLVYAISETIQQLRKIASPLKIEIATSGSIKDHQTYQGVAQTVIQRVKFGQITNASDLAGALLSSSVGKADYLVGSLMEHKGIAADQYPKLYEMAIDSIRKDNPINSEKFIAELADPRNPSVIGALSQQANQAFDDMPPECRTAALLAANIKRIAAEQGISLGASSDQSQSVQHQDPAPKKPNSIQKTLDAAFDY